MEYGKNDSKSLYEKLYNKANANINNNIKIPKIIINKPISLYMDDSEVDEEGKYNILGKTNINKNIIDIAYKIDVEYLKYLSNKLESKSSEITKTILKII